MLSSFIVIMSLCQHIFISAEHTSTWRHYGWTVMENISWLYSSSMYVLYVCIWQASGIVHVNFCIKYIYKKIQ